MTKWYDSQFLYSQFYQKRKNDFFYVGKNKNVKVVCVCLHSAFVGPSLECCTLACSYYLGAQQNFVDSLPAAVATCIVVLASVARPLASDTDPFDVLAASFALS